MKIYLVAGHGGDDTGAVYHGRKESDLTKEFVRLLRSQLKLYTIELGQELKNGLDLNEKSKIINNTCEKDDLAIEFHFNAFSDFSVSGTECLVKDNKELGSHIDVANKICYQLSNVLCIKNRGIKSEKDSYRGKLAFLNLKCKSIIVEICFMSNEKDMESYERNIDTLVRKMINVF
jgi:N-acetylmuramoyl-L-alanine amidase